MSWAEPDLGRVWVDCERVLSPGWDLMVTRRSTDRYIALAQNGSTRRWKEAGDPVTALEGLQDLLLDEIARDIP